MARPIKTFPGQRNGDWEVVEISPRSSHEGRLLIVEHIYNRGLRYEISPAQWKGGMRRPNRTLTHTKAKHMVLRCVGRADMVGTDRYLPEYLLTPTLAPYFSRPVDVQVFAGDRLDRMYRQEIPDWFFDYINNQEPIIINHWPALVTEGSGAEHANLDKKQIERLPEEYAQAFSALQAARNTAAVLKGRMRAREQGYLFAKSRYDSAMEEVKRLEIAAYGSAEEEEIPDVAALIPTIERPAPTPEQQAELDAIAASIEAQGPQAPAEPRFLKTEHGINFSEGTDAFIPLWESSPHIWRKGDDGKPERIVPETHDERMARLAASAPTDVADDDLDEIDDSEAWFLKAEDMLNRGIRLSIGDKQRFNFMYQEKVNRGERKPLEIQPEKFKEYL